MKKIRVAIVGATGRMGKEIVNLLSKDSGAEVAAEVSLEKGIDKLKPKGVDVVIDFSLPEGATEALEWCLRNNVPLVSGTTGIDAGLKKKIQAAGKKIPVLWSPNMSLGVAVLRKVLSTLPKVEGFDFQIEEFHHNKKKDKPSGTALFLQEALEKRVGKKLEAPVAIRGGGIFGIHKVHMMSEEETLCLEHVALNRTVFARGAVQAAKWIVGKKPGAYEMSDVIS